MGDSLRAVDRRSSSPAEKGRLRRLESFVPLVCFLGNWRDFNLLEAFPMRSFWLGWLFPKPGKEEEKRPLRRRWAGPEINTPSSVIRFLPNNKKGELLKGK